MPLKYVGTAGSGEAPQIEDGTYAADFIAASSEAHPDWATDKDRFGKPDTGDRIRWDFTVFDQGDAIPLNKLTRVGGFNTKSKTVPHEVKIIKALMTKKEFSAFAEEIEATKTAEDRLAVVNTALELIEGRSCQVEVENNDKDWPQIVSVIAKAK